MTIHITHPLAEWLDANGIDWRHAVAWPRVVVDYASNTISIEEFDQDEHGTPKVYKGGGRAHVLSKMATYPMVMPPFPPMIDEYRQVREYERLLDDMRSVLRELNFAASVPPGPCPSTSPGMMTHPESGEYQHWCVLRAGHHGDHETKNDPTYGYARWKEQP